MANKKTIPDHQLSEEQLEHIAVTERIINSIGHGYGIRLSDDGTRAIMIPSKGREDALAFMELVKAVSAVAVQAAPTLQVIYSMTDALEAIYAGKPHVFDQAIECMPTPDKQH